jgi:acyl carrier protein
MSRPPESKDEIFRTIKDVLCTHFGLRASLIVPGARLVEDLDLDSLDSVDLAVRLEMETGQELREADLGAMRTIQDVVDVVHRRLTAGVPTDA